MKEINALKLRNNLGEILETLNRTGEPIIVNKGHKAQAVLITPEQFQLRFLDYQTEGKKQKMLELIQGLKKKRLGDESSVEILRELRGYKL